MEPNKIDISNLRSIKNYALKESVTTSYIYKLIKLKRIESVDIDGVKFIDIKLYPSIQGVK